MDPDCLNDYLNSYVKLVLINGHYYKGKVVDVKDSSITIIDIRNARVTLEASGIIQIEEVSK